MSDEKTKSPDSPSPPPSSASLPSDPSLERLLGAIAKGLDGLVNGNLELRRAFADLHKFISQHSTRHERRVADLQVAVEQFTYRVEAVVTAQQVVVGTTVDARRALEDSRKSLDQAVEDITSQHELMNPENEEGAAPLVVRVWMVKLANFVWPFAMRSGKQALVWGVKLAAGTTVLGALGKLLHDLVNGHVGQ